MKLEIPEECQKGCDFCEHYEWYRDWCNKWKCVMHPKTILSCFKSRKEKDDTDKQTNAEDVL